MGRTYLTAQSTEDIIGDSFQSLDKFSAAPTAAGPAPTERESLDDYPGTVDLGRFANQMCAGEGDAIETPLGKRYFPRESMGHRYAGR